MKTAVAALLMIALSGCGPDPVASDFTGRWSAAPESLKLLQGRLSAPQYTVTLGADGTAVLQNVPDNVHGNPPGPLVSGTGTWRLARSSGLPVLDITVASGGRTLGLQFQILRDAGEVRIYVDLTDPDQVERFVYVRSAP
jgi:hypothetical protein